MRINNYLNTTTYLNLIINSINKPILEAYAYADWVGDTQKRKSTTGNRKKYDPMDHKKPKLHSALISRGRICVGG